MEVSLAATRLRVRLEAPSERRAPEFIAAALRSRTLHRGLVTVPSTQVEFDDYLASCNAQRVFSRLVVNAQTQALAGVVEVRDRTNGPAACGRLAYYAFLPHTRQGLMTEGAALAVAHAFSDLDLEELRADVQRGNGRSAALLERLGFRRLAEPVVRKVGRRWLEHERWRLPRVEWRAHAHEDTARA